MSTMPLDNPRRQETWRAPPFFPAFGHHAETEIHLSTDLGQIQIHSEFANSGMDELLEAFGIRRPLSRKGNPYDNAVIESTNKILKRELIYRRAFASLDQLSRELNSYVRCYNEERIHSTLGCMSPVEFRKAGLSL